MQTVDEAHASSQTDAGKRNGFAVVVADLGALLNAVGLRLERGLLGYTGGQGDVRENAVRLEDAETGTRSRGDARTNPKRLGDDGGDLVLVWAL